MITPALSRALLGLLLVGARLAGQDRPLTPPVAHPPAGRLLGVFDGQTGTPVTGAVVTDLLTGDHMVTTRTGTVSLSFVKAKGSVVQVRKLGYEPWSAVVDPADTTPITVVLEHVTALAPVVTTAKHNMLADAGTRAGIEERCQAAHVTCVRESEFANSPSRAPADFLVKAVGIVARPGLAMHSTLGGFCKPSYFVDGMAWTGADAPIDDRTRRRFSPDPAYTTSDLVTIEVYEAGVARPLRFTANPSCGVIVIWTK